MFYHGFGFGGAVSDLVGRLASVVIAADHQELQSLIRERDIELVGIRFILCCGLLRENIVAREHRQLAVVVKSVGGHPYDDASRRPGDEGPIAYRLGWKMGVFPRGTAITEANILQLRTSICDVLEECLQAYGEDNYEVFLDIFRPSSPTDRDALVYGWMKLFDVREQIYFTYPQGPGLSRTSLYLHDKRDTDLLRGALTLAGLDSQDLFQYTHSTKVAGQQFNFWKTIFMSETSQGDCLRAVVRNQRDPASVPKDFFIRGQSSVDELMRNEDYKSAWSSLELQHRGVGRGKRQRIVEYFQRTLGFTGIAVQGIRNTGQVLASITDHNMKPRLGISVDEWASDCKEVFRAFPGLLALADALKQRTESTLDAFGMPYLVVYLHTQSFSEGLRAQLENILVGL